MRLRWTSVFLVTTLPSVGAPALAQPERADDCGAVARARSAVGSADASAAAKVLWQAALVPHACAEADARSLGYLFPLRADLAVEISAAMAEPATRSAASRALIAAAACAREPTWLRAALELLALPIAEAEQEELRRRVQQAVLAADCSAFGGEPAERAGWLLELAHHPQEEVALLAVTLLGQLRPSGSAIMGLLRRLQVAQQEQPRQRAALLEALAKAGPAAYPATRSAERALAEESPAVKRAALELLAALGPRAMPAVEAIAKVARTDPDASIRRAARDTLGLVRGLPLEPSLRSRLCLRALRAPAAVCCEPECPRWADLGTRGTLDLAAGQVAAVGVRSTAESQRGRVFGPQPSALELATTTWRRFLVELMRGGVDVMMRSAPVANTGGSQPTTTAPTFALVEDGERRARAEAVVDELSRTLRPQRLADAGERAVLVGLSLDALVSQLRAQPLGRRRTATLLAGYLDELRGRPMPVVEVPAWVQQGTGWYANPQAAVFRALGAAYGEATRLGQGAADRRALDLLTAEVSVFSAELVGIPGARPEWRTLLVTETRAMVAQAGQVLQRWHDEEDGRWYALAELDLSDYMTLLAATPAVPAALRRHAEQHAARVFASAPGAGDFSAAMIRPRAPTAVSLGQVWPIEGRLSGAVAADARGRLWLAGERDQGAGSWRLAPTGEVTWRGKAGGWQALTALSTAEATSWEAALLASSGGSRVTVAGLDEEGETSWQTNIEVSGWARVDGVLPASERELYLAVADGGLVRLGERRAAVMRVTRQGEIVWTHSVSGRGETRVAGMVSADEGSVVVLADAHYCLDPRADPGCGADPFCEWNPAHGRCAWNKVLTRLSRQGQVIWERRLKIEGRAAALLPRAAGGYWVLTAGHEEAVIARADARGMLSWQKGLRLPLAATPRPRLCQPRPDDLLLTGTTMAGDLLVARIDGTGVLAEQVAYGGRGREVGLFCWSRGERTWVVGESDSLDLPGADPDVANAIYRIELSSDE